MSKRVRRQQRQKKEKRWQGEKCPFCKAHLRENEEWDGEVVVRFVDCPKCGQYHDAY